MERTLLLVALVIIISVGMYAIYRNTKTLSEMQERVWGETQPADSWLNNRQVSQRDTTEELYHTYSTIRR